MNRLQHRLYQFGFLAVFVFVFFLHPQFTSAQSPLCTMRISPDSGPSNKVFTIFGGCSMKAATITLVIKGAKGSTVRKPLITDSDGKYTTSLQNIDLAETSISATEMGYTLSVEYLNNIVSSSINPAKIIITKAVNATCGEEVTDGSKNKCPKECPATIVGAVWKCTVPIPTPTKNPNGNSTLTCPDGVSINTALGCIDPNPGSFVTALLNLGIGIGGGIAFLLILIAGLQISTSQGNPEKLQAGRELVGAAISGLMVIIFSVFLLKLIGVNILTLPGFSAPQATKNSPFQDTGL